MAARRFVVTLALAFILVAAGCRSWCDHHYPCNQSCGQPACVPCVPCCPTNSAYQVPPAPPAPPNWNAPRGDCRCP